MCSRMVNLKCDLTWMGRARASIARRTDNYKKQTNKRKRDKEAIARQTDRSGMELIMT